MIINKLLSISIKFILCETLIITFVNMFSNNNLSNVKAWKKQATVITLFSKSFSKICILLVRNKNYL